MRKLMPKNLNGLPFRYKFRFVFLSASLLVNTWALASLVPNQNITLAHKAVHQTISTEKLSLGFTQKKTTTISKPDTVLKPDVLIDDKIKEQIKTKEHAKPLRKIVKNEPIRPIPKAVELEEIRESQAENQTNPEAKSDIDSLAQSRKTHHPLVSEPSFSKPPEQPRYPSLARKRGQQGTVWLEVWLDAAGEQIKREITASSGVNILDKAALKAVSRWEFLPFSQEDIAIASRVKIPVQFVLN